jgi:hypothetical protein
MIWSPTLAQQQAAMSKMWSIFLIDAESPIALRAIPPKDVQRNLRAQNFTFTAKTYPAVVDRQQAFEKKALELNSAGYNVYIVMNQIDPSFAGDEANQLAVKDEHIIRRRHLLIDIDRQVAVEPIAEDEIDILWEFAHKIEKDLFYNKGEEPISVFSGNGAHIYLPIDLSNDDLSKVTCQRFLKVLADKYDDASYQIDTIVYNAVPRQHLWHRFEVVV